MPKLRITTEQNRPIHQGRVFPYLAVTKLVVELPIANTGDRFTGGTLYAEISAYAEVADELGTVRIYHPEFKRSLTIPNFQPQGALLQVASGLIQSQLTDLGAIEVVS
jgi:hypothetical protein